VTGPDSDLRAALLGGAAVSEATLVRFYVLHCVALPLAAVLLMGLHFWRVRKDGFSGPL
jgi:quinol-cytochrome oxidoreductase complex cytochrome b subunit